MNLELDLVQSVALTVVVAVVGEALRRRVELFNRFCIPGPVIGGFGVALLVLVLRQVGGVTFDVDTTLQTPAMVAFFTTVGLGASLGLLKLGGRFLLVYLVGCWTVAIFQNLVGVGLAHLLGIDRLLGVMAGSVSLEGGHGAAAAFGPTAEAMGVEGATAVAIASATFGLVAGSLLGGPLAAWLIRRHRLPIEPKAIDERLAAADAHDERPVTGESLLQTGAVVAVVMAAGVALGSWFSDATGFTLPSYVGAMVVAIVVRNIDDRLRWLKMGAADLGVISTVTLGYFLTQAMMTLRIWDLATLAGPLAIILVVQTLVLLAFTAFVLFRLLGANYDAATMCAGMMGHGLGGTPNAIANMDAVGRRFGAQSRLGLIVVPLSGAVLIDIVALPWIVFCLNAFR